MSVKSLSSKIINVGVTFAAFFCVGITHAQLTTDNWAVGGGLSYPKFFSANITPQNMNYGLYLSGQRNLSEHVGVRLKSAYSHLEGEWLGEREKTNLLTTDLGLLYYFVPCDVITPYLFTGVGANYKFLTNKQSASVDANSLGSQLHLGTGAEYKINPDWNFVAEFGYYMTSNSDLDGAFVPTEMNGRDSYIILSVGVNYVFGKGKPSLQCNNCGASSNTDSIDYQRVEELIIKHIPKEVEKVVIKETVRTLPVEKCFETISEDRLALVGVNFDFDKSEILPESYPVLDKAVQMLKAKPNAKVEIEGYTDDVGTIAYNQKLSVERAERVKAYLVSKGIPEKSLTTVGYGKNNPVEDNETQNGREMNRRIVFKTIK